MVQDKKSYYSVAMQRFLHNPKITCGLHEVTTKESGILIISVTLGVISLLSCGLDWRFTVIINYVFANTSGFSLLSSRTLDLVSKGSFLSVCFMFLPTDN